MMMTLLITAIIGVVITIIGLMILMNSVDFDNFGLGIALAGIAILFVSGGVALITWDMETQETNINNIDINKTYNITPEEVIEYNATPENFDDWMDSLLEDNWDLTWL